MVLVIPGPLSPHTTPLKGPFFLSLQGFLPPEDPFPVLLRPNSIPE